MSDHEPEGHGRWFKAPYWLGRAEREHILFWFLLMCCVVAVVIFGIIAVAL
jgi:hypothetical protein